MTRARWRRGSRCLPCGLVASHRCRKMLPVAFMSGALVLRGGGLSARPRSHSGKKPVNPGSGAAGRRATMTRDACGLLRVPSECATIGRQYRHSARKVKSVARKVKEPVAAVKASAMSKFANQLRGWRAKRGWSQAELADQLGYSNALVSQIEQEHKPPSAEFAAKCDEVFDTPATFADFQELVAREAWPSYFAPVIDSETRATQVHEWEQRVVPGLLQTEDYARSVIRAGQPRITPDELERKVAMRLERQAIFGREDREADVLGRDP